MKIIILELIGCYLKGEISLQILTNIKEDISNMTRKEKNKLRTYCIAISLIGEIAGEKLREVFKILIKLKSKKMVRKIMNHRKIMVYDEDIDAIKI